MPNVVERGSRPRLLVVTRDRYPPFRVDLTELFSRWLTPRFDIDWVMARQASGPIAVIAGRPGERFLVSRRGVLPWLGLQWREGLRVASGGVDLVQVRDAALSAAFFYVAARIGGRPFVYWMSYPMAEGYRHRALHPAPGAPPLLRLGRLAYGTIAGFILYRMVLPRAHHVFVQSERMKADVAARGIALERITAIPMGVSIDLHHPGTIAPVDDPRLIGLKVLIYLGSLDPERKIETLVQTLALVAGRGFDVVLVIVGVATAADRRRLEREAQGQDISKRLIFTGHLPLTEALAYVRRADICLAPFPTWPATYLSATPTKLVEYLAMGRPVVAGEHPDQRQVIEQSGAGLIVSDTAEGFAAAVSSLLANPDDAEAMGRRGPAWVSAHRDYAALSNTVAEVYQRLIGPSGA